MTEQLSLILITSHSWQIKQVGIYQDYQYVLSEIHMLAVYFEQKDWENCLKQCEQAVDKGRELRADFKIIAKWAVG